MREYIFSGSEQSITMLLTLINDVVPEGYHVVAFRGERRDGHSTVIVRVSPMKH